MPFLPSALPNNLTSLLSSLRSPIFQTQHNPLAQRLGTKYLRRRLRGPSLTEYYPSLPNLRSLNRQAPNNIYSNWQGLVQPESLLVGKRSHDQEGVVAWRAQVVTGREVVPDGFDEVERVGGAGWLWDEMEDARLTKVARRRRIGKGPPKKGGFGMRNLIVVRFTDGWVLGHGRKAQMRGKR